MALGPDRLSGKGGGATDSGTPFPITPSDGGDLSFVTRAISFTGGGNLVCDVVNADGTVTASQTLPVIAGMYPWRISKVYATGTTATGIVGTR